MAVNGQSQVTLSHFKKIALVGEGAASEVWKARVTKAVPFARQGDLVALKIYRPEILREPAQRQRIAEEYRTGATLTHPNLVKIHHVVIEESSPFLAMDWCGGRSLLAWRQENPEPDEEFLLQFSTQMLDVLEFLHSSKRIHRDVTPSNIKIDEKGKIRLLDYGIVRSLWEPNITPKDARFIGAYRYSAPEYIFRQDCSYSLDLYAFGAVLYFVLHRKEVFADAKRTVDIIDAKRSHKICFDPRVRQKGPVWAAVYSLSQQLLESKPSQRPASAMACLDILARALSLSVPFRVHFALSPTCGDKARSQRNERIAGLVHRCGKHHGFSVSFSGDHWHTTGAAHLSAAEIYWIDRERVASSDLLFVLADNPTFRAGQEAEIAANAGVPIVIFHSTGIDVSRTLRGIPGRIIGQFSFNSDTELYSKAKTFFKDNKGRLQLSRMSREREYHLRVGNRVREIREAKKLAPCQLAQNAEVSKELIDRLETRPEQASNISLVNLRRIARALDVTPAELLKDHSTKDQQFEDIFRSRLGALRALAQKLQLSYDIYAKLKECGREALRKETTSSPVGFHLDWQNLYKDLMDGNLANKDERDSEE